MSKPQGTYLHINKAAKVASGVADARLMEERTAARRKDEFERLLKNASLDLTRAKREARECENFLKAPESTRGRLRMTLTELLKQLNKFADLATKQKELSAELQAPAKTFITQAKNVQLDAVSIPQLAMAAVVFILVIEKVYTKVRNIR